jgi:hypothetical protein
MAMKEVVKPVGQKDETKVSLSAYSYREVPGLEGGHLDVIEQLHANLAQIEDLHARLRFVMTEVRGLVVKS